MVLYCDVTSLFFVFVCKPFAMDEELYQYALRSPRLPDSPPGVCAETPPGEVSWTDDDPQRNHFSGDSEGSVVDLTLSRPKRKEDY